MLRKLFEWLGQTATIVVIIFMLTALVAALAPSWIAFFNSIQF